MSNVGTKARQFLNVVTEKCSGGVNLVRKGSNSLRRIKASDLFYGSTEEALLAQQEQEAKAAADPCAQEMMTRSRLPPPQIKFKQSRPVDCWMDFWPFYGATSESSKILCVDAAGEAVLYDAGAGTLETLPRFRSPMGSGSDLDHVALSVALPDAHDPARPDALYVIDHRHGSFEALVYGPYSLGRCVWRWRQLPMPPFTRDPSHGSIQSYAMLPEPGGGGTICVSSVSDKVGTYCFDTSRERWTKAAGSWRLPFRGRGQVVPELDALCFGVGSYPYCNQLCAVDLSSVVSMDGPPKLRHHWPLMETPAPNVCMAYMGAGRFCIGKTFFVYNQDPRRFVDHETVLNGVEVVRENGGPSKSEPKLRMISHKCVRYRLINHRIHVL